MENNSEFDICANIYWGNYPKSELRTTLQVQLSYSLSPKKDVILRFKSCLKMNGNLSCSAQNQLFVSYKKIGRSP